MTRPRTIAVLIACGFLGGAGFARGDVADGQTVIERMKARRTS